MYGALTEGEISKWIIVHSGVFSCPTRHWTMESVVTTGPWTGMVTSGLSAAGTTACSFSAILVTNRVFPIPARCEEMTLTHDLHHIKVYVVYTTIHSYIYPLRSTTEAGNEDLVIV